MEASRLEWLRVTGILAPRVLHLVKTANHDCLVMECLPGANALVSNDIPEVKVRLVADDSRKLNAIQTGTCPFDETISCGTPGDARKATYIGPLSNDVRTVYPKAFQFRFDGGQDRLVIAV